MPEDFAPPPGPDATMLQVDVEGFEGPLDLLLTLARSQRVDLRRISILALAEQYLAVIATAKRRRIELAADWLVMAAWLAWLKSRLLLPPDPAAPGPSAEDLAGALAFRLERLEAMRRAAARMLSRDRLGRDRFVRGMPEAITLRRGIVWQVGLIDLLRAYGGVKAKADLVPLHLSRPPVLTMDEALARLRAIIGTVPDWTDLMRFLPEDWCGEPARRRSAKAATFAALLELVKRGAADLRQEASFGPIELRAARRAPDA